MPVEVFRTLIDEETLNSLSRRESSLDYEIAAIMRVLLDMDDETDRVEVSQMFDLQLQSGGVKLELRKHFRNACAFGQSTSLPDLCGRRPLPHSNLC